MQATRRAIVQALVACLALWPSRRNAAAQLNRAIRAVPLQHAATFFGPYLARTGALSAGMECELKRQNGRVFVLAADRLIGCVSPRDRDSVIGIRSAHVGRVWRGHDRRLRITLAVS